MKGQKNTKIETRLLEIASNINSQGFSQQSWCMSVTAFEELLF